MPQTFPGAPDESLTETTYTSFDFLLSAGRTAGVVDNNEFILVHLNQALPVPEPETYALMLAGLGLVGFAARRKKAGQAEMK